MWFNPHHKIHPNPAGQEFVFICCLFTEAHASAISINNSGCCFIYYIEWINIKIRNFHWKSLPILLLNCCLERKSSWSDKFFILYWHSISQDFWISDVCSKVKISTHVRMSCKKGTVLRGFEGNFECPRWKLLCRQSCVSCRGRRVGWWGSLRGVATWKGKTNFKFSNSNLNWWVPGDEKTWK